MRRALTIVLLLSSASVARAEGMGYSPLVDASIVDPPCRQLALIPRNTRNPGLAYDAAISTANCMIMQRTKRLPVAPTQESVQQIDAAIAPAMRILDRVIATGDPAHAVLAQYAELDALEGNTARILSSIKALPPQMSSKEAYDHYKDLSAADALTSSWRESMLHTRRAIAINVRNHPDLATRDPVVAYAIANSRLPAVPVARR